MLAEYDQYVLNDASPLETGDADSVVCSSTSSIISPMHHQDPYMYRDLGLGPGYLPDCRWPCPGGAAPEQPAEESYTLTVLSDGSQPGEQPHLQPHPQPHPQPHLQPHLQQPLPPPPAYGEVQPWETWQQHGPGHVAEDVTGSDGSSSPERRCVRSLLHVALQRGSSFAQQFTSCGVPPLPPPPPSCYPIKQEPGVFVSSSTSTPSPRPVTPADSLRSCYSPAFAPHLPPACPSDDGVGSTTSSFPPAYPSYYRTPYPTPSPDPCYPAPLLPLPVQMFSSPPASQASPPLTPTSRGSKRRRSKASPTTRKRERSERQLHPCSLCEKRFKDNYSVNVHMRTHTGEKPFPCIVCGKMFRQKAHLAKHRSTHQPSEYVAASHSADQGAALGTGLGAGLGAESGVDRNSNSLPLWAESKCKAPNVWTPSIISPSPVSLPWFKTEQKSH